MRAPDQFTGAARRACLKIVALRRPFEAQARVGKGARRIRRLFDDAGNGLDDGAEIGAARIWTRNDDERKNLSTLRGDQFVAA